ncbi:MAG TPA: ABC transporter permease [Chloroflexota bacterium]|nr:ABC transporter permease [Chloroflexota bacterium]
MSTVESVPQVVADRPDGAVDEVVTGIREWEVVLGPLPAEATGSMAVRESISAAIEALQANKLRAFLTTLGIIIGVSAVIVMIALGEGARQSVQERLARLGTNMLVIMPGSGNIGGVRTGNGALPSLNESDAQAILAQIPGVVAVSPILNAGGTQVVAGDQNWSTQIQGGYPSIFTLQDWQIAEGQAFDEGDESSAALVCVIGQTVARNLFPTTDPVGQKILIRNVPFTVKGVLAPKGSNGFEDQDDIILMPYETAQIRLFHRPFVNSIYVQVAQSDQIDTVQQAITDLLRTRHHIRPNQQDDFRVRNNNQIIDTAQQASNTFTYLLAGVAAVSLVVGGIGIMNIMLVSVTERTREIGIRMAVGARGANILSQFLIEAVLLSVVGGIVGILIGMGGSVGLSRIAGWETIITPQAILLSFGFAALVGVFFGYYPARKAAQLDPIEALRYE